MIKTVVYLPEDLKVSLEQVAREEQRSEAEIIYQSLRSTLAVRHSAKPKLPLTERGLGDPAVAETVDQHLQGFGTE